MAISTIDSSGLNQAGNTNFCTTSGNVGIGTNNPTQRLNIANSSSSGFAATRLTTDARSFDIGLGGSAAGYMPNNLYFYDVTANATRMVIDTSGNFQFNSGYGSVATAYGCRAWVNFNGTGTVAIRASGNVSSITDNGTGNYTVNFATTMPDSNYMVTFGNNEISGGTSSGRVLSPTSVGTAPSIMSTSAVQFIIDTAGGTLLDVYYVGVAIFR